MNRILKITRLHLNRLANFLGTPAIILGVVLLVSIIIALAIQRATGLPSDHAEYIDGARMNMGVVWSLPGFLIYYGVQAVATTYPFALALGTTRRNFILGTMLSNVLQAAYVAVMLVILLGLELATGHWFSNTYVLDVYAVGSGNPWILAISGFLGVLFCLTVGGLFGAIWVRFGAKGPAVLGLGLGLTLALVLLVLAPNLGDIIAGLTRGGLAIGALCAILVSLVGTWFAMRRASVR
ncbi:hypothetical protein [Leucobacter chromiireducens]|uniref:ABC transporter permease n=1 Tax=Leucobacter chromiireducens subsp. solipictus TaxID=398235 RepID=A0ABS1SDA1_9MICO|nr:hypothetical protein [Leucobacter chromiireducens]MBL3678455.1 hypothetical protein [Leucobacter chromiireducens subsp. solipictus]